MLVVPWLMSRGPAEPRGADDDDALSAGPRPFFTSPKERQLWAWTAVVLVAIYATLAPAAELAAWLRARNLLRLTTSTVLIGVVIALAVPWLKRRPGRREVGAAIGIAAVYLTTIIRLPVPEARSHLFEYGLVAMLVYHALSERRKNGRHVPIPSLIALVATILLGWLDEVIQYFLPTRTYDLRDVGFNAVAAFMAITASLLMGWTRRLDLPGRMGLRKG